MTRFKDLQPGQKRLSGFILVIGLALIVAAQRDLQHRSAAELRGGKLLWRLVCLNGLGALVYFKWGRRPPSPPAAPAAG